MANNLIQIKRSVNTAVPSSLANGELAFTANDSHLFIGSPNGSIIPIGGFYNYGVLTANQALVANATGFIDAVKTANLTARSITANGVSSPGAGYVLSVDAGGNTFWLQQTALTINTAAQYSWTNTHTFSANVTLNGALIANGAAGTANQVLKSNGTSIYWATDDGDISAVTAGNGLSGGGTSGAVTVNVLANNGIVANSTGTFVTGGSTVTVNATGVHVNTANLTFATSQITSGNFVATVSSGNGVTASATSGTGSTPTLYAIGGVGTVVNTSGINVLANNGIVANSTGTFARAANGISVDASGINVLAGTGGGLVSNSTGVFVTAGSGLVANATGVHVGTANGITVDADAIRVNGGSTLTVNATGVHVNSSLSITDLTLSGNLTVSGTLTTVNTTNLTVTDSLIKLANGNSSTDALDIGTFGVYGATGAKYTGLFRDATDGIYKLFTGLTVEPTTTVDTSNASYTIATLQAYLNSGALVSNATNLALTANSTVNVAIVANNISWSGLAQNGIIYGGAGGTFTNLSAGAGGTVLMISTAGVPEFAVLDGGSF